MSFTTPITLRGPLRHPRQMLAEQEYGGHTSIHDDATAERLGLRAGPIEGPTHFSLFPPLLQQIWGQAWFERGCISSHYLNIDPCDGAKAEYLIASARTRVAALDSEIRGYVARMLDKIAAYATVDDDSLFAARAAVGATALNIADVAGAIGMETIGEIARGLDAMVHSAAHGGVWRPDAVRLHIQSLGMVDQTRPDRTGEATILENLRALRLATGAGE